MVDNQALALAGSVSAGTIDLTTPGLTQVGSGAITTGILTSTGGITGDASLLGTANQIGTISGLTANNLTVVNSHALILAGAVSVGAAGTLDIGTTGGGSVTEGNGRHLIAGVVTSASGIAGDVILTDTANQIGTISQLTASGGHLTVVDDQTLAFAGTVNRWRPAGRWTFRLRR